MRSKVTVVGAGNVGATAVQRIHQLGYANAVLVDVVEDLPQGKALDMLESGPVIGSDAMVIGSNDYEATADSDVVVITAGIARRPGMSRDDLLLTNMNITSAVTEQVVKYSPNCIILAVTNPLDAMCQNILESSGFPRSRVFGMAGVLDTARFRTFIAQEMNVSVEDVQAYVLGGHGDDMVPLVRYTTVGDFPGLYGPEGVEPLHQPVLTDDNVSPAANDAGCQLDRRRKSICDLGVDHPECIGREEQAARWREGLPVVQEHIAHGGKYVGIPGKPARDVETPREGRHALQRDPAVAGPDAKDAAIAGGQSH